MTGTGTIVGSTMSFDGVTFTQLSASIVVAIDPGSKCTHRTFS